MARPRRPVGGRAEARLDPVRWRRPGRGTVLRLAAVTVFLFTAALIGWSGPDTCAPTSATTGAEGRVEIAGAGTAGSTKTSTGGTAADEDDGNDKPNGQSQGNGQGERNGQGQGQGQSQSNGNGQGQGNGEGKAASQSESAVRGEGQSRIEGKAQTETPGPSPGRAGVPTGRVGVPVRLAEPAALTLVHPGDRVDLLRIADDNHGTSPVAAAALVLGVTGADDPTTGGLLVALTPAEAATVVTGSERGFAVLIRP